MGTYIRYKGGANSENPMSLSLLVPDEQSGQTFEKKMAAMAAIFDIELKKLNKSLLLFLWKTHW